MRKLTFLLVCLFVASIGLVNAQSRTASGKVISAEDGLPVIGASVIVKGSAGKGTVTDLDGAFSLTMPGNSQVIVVSYIGMKSKEVEAKTNMIIQLESSSSELDEVMVIAYGTAKKSAFTGSAATIKSENIMKRQVSNVTNALSGQVAGVQVTNLSGQPGTAGTVRIRGIGSMSASNNPLYVVDGIPYDGSISAINPSDIESINVLKDAAASAIYGARGANGVIIITTKRGSTKEALVTFDAKWGTNSRAIPNYDVMTDPAMYYETFYKALYNSKAQMGNSAEESHKSARTILLDDDAGGLGYQVYDVPAGEYFIGTNFKINPNAKLGFRDDEYFYTPDNWYNELFEKGNLRQEYNASVSGSTDKIDYYFSFGYLDDSGIIEGSGFKRFTARSKVDYQAKKWLKIGANMGYTNYDIMSPGSQTDWGSSGNLFYATNMIAPIYPMYVRTADGKIKVDDNGYTVYDYGTSTNQKRAFLPLSNPAIEMKLDQHHAYTDVLSNKWYGIVDLFSGLKFTANIGANIRNQRSSHLYNPYYGSGVTDGGSVSMTSYRELGINQQYLLTYAKDLGLSSIDVLAGIEDYKLKMQTMYGYNKKLFNPNIPELGNAIYTPPTLDSYTDTYVTKGFIGRVQYDYAEKIFASASYRRDASSRFHPDNRWGNFGSAGAAWIISREDFFENLNASWIDILKLKASYGVQGNDNLTNYYAYLDQYKVVNNNGIFSTSMNYKGNKDITWETSYSFNSGFEFALFGDILNGSFEYFSRNTVDLLYNQPVPSSLGYPNSTSPLNVGSMVNSGIEFDLNAHLVKTKDFNWSLNLNATSYKNKITDLHKDVKTKGIRFNTRIWAIDGSLYDAFLREYAGVDNHTGEALYYLADGDGNFVLDSEGNKQTTSSWSETKQVNLGSTLPKVYGGFGTTLNFKGLDFSASLSYQLGGKVYDFSYEELMHTGYSNSKGVNWHLDILNAWTEENRNSDIPRLNASDDSYQQLSSRFLTSSNYISLNNITLGYSIPKSFLNKFDISGLRVYVVGDNLGLLSARKGLDPRQALGAENWDVVGAHNYSALRSLSAGVTLTF